MTNLEIILLATLWVIYGVYHGYKWGEEGEVDETGAYVISIMFSPVCFTVRSIKGVLCL